MQGEALLSLNTLTERKSRFVLITKLQRKLAEETSRAVIERLVCFPSEVRQTLTLDNGTENARHEDIAEVIGTKCYFARPYASAIRGTNENTNGLIRWYLPKRTNFSIITEGRGSSYSVLLNNRPRKCLDYKTPIEVVSSFVALQG